MSQAQDKLFADPPRSGCRAQLRVVAGLMTRVALLALGLVLLAWLAGDRF